MVPLTYCIFSNRKEGVMEKQITMLATARLSQAQGRPEEAWAVCSSLPTTDGQTQVISHP